MNLRKARLTDLKSIIKIYEDLIEHHAEFDDFFWNTKDMVKDWKKRQSNHIRRYIKNKNKMLLVAEDKKKLIGFIAFEFKKRPSIFKQNKYFHLHLIAVSKNQRGKNIGTKLMNKALKIAKKRKVFAANVNVRTANKSAWKFYSKFGFKNTMIELVKKL